MMMMSVEMAKDLRHQSPLHPGPFACVIDPA
jgi:hypothetical protein